MLKKILISFSVIILIAIGVVYGLTERSLKSPTILNSSDIADKKEPVITNLSSKILFMGTTFWGRYINDWSIANELKYAYPFSRLSEFNRSDYNAWIAGLECPTSPRVNTTSAEQEVQLQFNCRPEYLAEAKKWFTAFSLANNHTDNQGVEGFMETKQELDKVGIQYFGHYDPRETADVCEVIQVSVDIEQSEGQVVEGRLPIALCGYHGVFRIPDQNSVDEIGKFAKYMPVFAMPHMGAEYKSSPDQIKTDFHRSLVDAGADAVIGDHPHWIQNTESYKGRLIVHSMGNFIFDQQLPPETTRSAAISVALSLKNPDNETLKQWLEIGKDCDAFKDDCLAEIESKNLPKLDFRYDFGVVGTNNYARIVKPATADELQLILKRLNWSETISQLQTPYYGN